MNVNSMNTAKSALLFSCLLLGSCLDTGTKLVEFRVEASGSNARFQNDFGWQIELSEAELLFGPLVLCPGVTAGDLCTTARGEMLSVAQVDLLDESTREIARGAGLEGSVGSAMWDYGRPWRLSDSEPEANGTSLIISGIAQQGDTSVPFSVSYNADSAGAGIVLVRVSGSPEGELSESTIAHVQFDVQGWLRRVHFDDDDLFEDDSRSIRALRNAMLVGARPRLELR